MADAADARRRAEEYLRFWGHNESDGIEIMRALLAAGPGAKTPRISRDDGHYELGLRMAITDAREYDLAWATWAQKLLDDANRVPELESLLRECNAVCLCGCPDSEHESYGEDGESCGHDDHECIRVAPAVLAYVERLRSTPPPPSDAVREASERLRRARESNFLTCTDSRVRAEGNRVLLLEVDALLATLATVTVPAGVAGPDDPIRVRLVPDDAAVREATEALTVYCDVCESDRRVSCHSTTTGDPAPYPHPERAVAAALAARGGE